MPLYTESKTELALRDNFEQLCKGAVLRTPEMETVLRCRLLHHQDVFTRLGPFRLEEMSLQPYIVIIKGLMEEEELAHFKGRAVNQVRSGRKP